MKWLLLSGTRDPFIYEAGWCLRVMFPECQAAPPPPTHPPSLPMSCSSMSSFYGGSGGRERGRAGFHVEASRGAPLV